MAKAIKAENLSKVYQLGNIGTGTISRDLERLWARLRGKEDPYLRIGEVNDRTTQGGDLVWSLKDISFEIEQGDAVGIIGRNGAGKSTLLKVLSRITSPTSGLVKIKGRMASLLEVGTGFHPELTGRENIYLNGAILGMRKKEITRKLEEIVEFAGVQRYIDTPVKRYSSGMYVRLAFAVAANLESDILIIDEVLAVGDAEFQKKCLGKMDDVRKGTGRTILFVSHNMASINSLCKTGIVLKNGFVDFAGDISSAITHYEKQGDIDETGRWINTDTKIDLVYLRSITVKNSSNEVATYFSNLDAITIEFDLLCIEDCERIKLGFDLLKNQEIVFRSHQVDDHSTDSLKKGETYLFRCTIPEKLLSSGEYQLRPLLSIHNVRGLLRESNPVLLFNVAIANTLSVHYHSNLTKDNYPGAIFPILKWNC